MLPMVPDSHVIRRSWIAPLTIMAGSLLTIIPVIATFTVLPPFGLLMLMGWRLHRPEVMYSWTPVLLGLFDDLVSGQPFGSAMLLWTVCTLGVDVLETRLLWRDFWQNWMLAGGAVGLCLVAGRLIASPIGAHVETSLLVQIAASAALYPAVARLVAWLDLRRERS